MRKPGRLAPINVATLVVTSDWDVLVPAACGPTSQHAISAARLTTMANAGHLAELDRRAAFAKVVAEFLCHDIIAAVA